MKLTSLQKKVVDLGYLREFKGKPFMQNTPNEFAYLDFKKWAYPRRGKIKQRLQAALDNNQANPGDSFFKELTRIWVMWANENDEAFSVVNPTNVGQKDFGRALAVMMKNDNLVINKKSNKLLNLNEDDRSEKDKMFDLAQKLSKLTKDDRVKLKKIQQMIAKEKNEEKIAGFDYHYTKGTSGGTQQFGRPRITNELEIDTPKGYSGTIPSDIEIPQMSINPPSISTSNIKVYDENIPDVTPPDISTPEVDAPAVNFGTAPQSSLPSLKISEYIKKIVKKLYDEKSSGVA